jgi:hypothetical protein
MDDFPAFHSGLSRWSMARYEQLLAERVSVLVVSSSALAQKFSQHASKTKLVFNAYHHSLPLPSTKDQQNYRPIIGYLGAMHEWFDWDLLLVLAKCQPESDFRLIGPLLSAPRMSLPPNVMILPPLVHAQAMEAMREFDVGLIPFKKNTLTASVDPIKYYEYRALGLPVLSSTFGEMARRGVQDGVFLLKDGEDPRLVFQQALHYQCDQQEILRFREQNDWEKRFAASELFL